jgi:hypothetical protein
VYHLMISDINPFYNSNLDYSWHDSILDSLVSIQEMNLKRSIISNISREVVQICKKKRDRVAKVELLLDEFGGYIAHEDKQEIFILVAETLLFIQFNGTRVKCTEDPIALLKG